MIFKTQRFISAPGQKVIQSERNDSPASIAKFSCCFFFIAQTYFIVKNRMIVKRSGNDPKGLGQEEEIFSV